MGPLHTTIGWNYVDQGCAALKFSLRGFERSQVTSNQLDLPRVEIISSTALFSFPTREFIQEGLHFNISGFAEGRLCEAHEDYFFLNDIIENGIHLL